MRANITLEARGTNATDVMKVLLAEWRRFVGDNSSELPHDSEVFIVEDDATSSYVATMHARVRLEGLK